MRFSEVACGRSDDRVIANHNFARLTDGLTYVVFAYEVGWFLHG
jgi:hypothetical protein